MSVYAVFRTLIKELGLEGKITHLQAAKKMGEPKEEIQGIFSRLNKEVSVLILEGHCLVSSVSSITLARKFLLILVTLISWFRCV